MQQIPREQRWVDIGLIEIRYDSAAARRSPSVAPLSRGAKHTLVQTKDPQLVRVIGESVRVRFLGRTHRGQLWSEVDDELRASIRSGGGPNWAAIKPKNLVVDEVALAVMSHLVHVGALVPEHTPTRHNDRWQDVPMGSLIMRLNAEELDAWEASRRLQLDG